MAEEQKKEQTVQVPVPEGMTAERLVELVQGYEERRIKNKARQDARKNAERDLRENHKDEFEQLVKKYMPKS